MLSAYQSGRVGVLCCRTAAILTALTAAACSTTATVVRADGSELEGRIVEGGRRGITIVDDNGNERRIPMGEIQAIHHPGRGAMIGGGVLLGYGILNIAVGAPHCGEKGGAFCTGVFLPALVGGILEIWGATVHSHSQEMAEGATPARRHNTYDGPPSPFAQRRTPPPGTTMPAYPRPIESSPPVPPAAVAPAPAGPSPAPLGTEGTDQAAPVPSAPVRRARQQSDDEDG